MTALPRKEKGYVGEQKSLSKSIIVKVKQQSPAEAKLVNLKQVIRPLIGDLAVTVTEVTSMNKSEGTIWAPELAYTGEENMMETLTDTVSKIEQLSKFNPDKNVHEAIPLYKITFKSRRIPETVNIGFLRYRVKQFYPGPRGCLCCLRYGHVMRTCPEKNRALCNKCGLNAGLDDEESKRLGKRVIKQHDCQTPPQCPNCKAPNNEHKPTDRNCPERKREIEVIRQKIDHDLSFPEARRRVAGRSFVSSDLSFAGAAQGPIRQNPDPGPSETRKSIIEMQRKIAIEEEELRELAQLEAYYDELLKRKSETLKRIEQKKAQTEKFNSQTPTINDIPSTSFWQPTEPKQTEESLPPSDNDLDMMESEIPFVAPVSKKRPMLNKQTSQESTSSQEKPPQKAQKKSSPFLEMMRTHTVNRFGGEISTPDDDDIQITTDQLRLVRKYLDPQADARVNKIVQETRNDKKPPLWYIGNGGLFVRLREAKPKKQIGLV